MEGHGMRSRVVGSRPLPAARVSPALVLNRLMRTPEARRAARELDAARRRLDYRSPCQEAPDLWDGGEEGEGWAELAERALVAIDRCQDCLVLPECTVLRTEDHTLDGVIAGELVGKDERSRKARDVMDQFRQLGRTATREEVAS